MRTPKEQNKVEALDAAVAIRMDGDGVESIIKSAEKIYTFLCIKENEMTIPVVNNGSHDIEKIIIDKDNYVYVTLSD